MFRNTFFVDELGKVTRTFVIKKWCQIELKIATHSHCCYISEVIPLNCWVVAVTMAEQRRFRQRGDHNEKLERRPPLERYFSQSLIEELVISKKCTRNSLGGEWVCLRRICWMVTDSHQLLCGYVCCLIQRINVPVFNLVAVEMKYWFLYLLPPFAFAQSIEFMSLSKGSQVSASGHPWEWEELNFWKLIPLSPVHLQTWIILGFGALDFKNILSGLLLCYFSCTRCGKGLFAALLILVCFWPCVEIRKAGNVLSRKLMIDETLTVLIKRPHFVFVSKVQNLYVLMNSVHLPWKEVCSFATYQGKPPRRSAMKWHRCSKDVGTGGYSGSGYIFSTIPLRDIGLRCGLFRFRESTSFWLGFLFRVGSNYQNNVDEGAHLHGRHCRRKNVTIVPFVCWAKIVVWNRKAKLWKRNKLNFQVKGFVTCKSFVTMTDDVGINLLLLQKGESFESFPIWWLRLTNIVRNLWMGWRKERGSEECVFSLTTPNRGKI